MDRITTNNRRFSIWAGVDDRSIPEPFDAAKDAHLSKERGAYQYLLLATFTLVAIILRFYQLGEWSLWRDEVYSITAAMESQNFYSSLTKLLIATSIQVIGLTEWSVRFFPAVIGVITIPILYFPIRRLFGPTVALLTSALIALSPWHIYWSQNARFYTILLLFYSLGLLLFLLSLEEDRFDFSMIAAICLTIAAAERRVAFFYVAIIISYLLLLRFLPVQQPRGLRWKNLLPMLLPLLIFGALDGYSYLSAVTGSPAQASVMATQATTAPDSVIYRLLNDFIGGSRNSPIWLVASIGTYIGIPLMCLAGLGILCLIRTNQHRSVFIGLSALLPFGLLLMLSAVMYTTDRYIFHTLTLWFIAAAVATTELLRHVRKGGWILAAGVLALILVGPLSQDVLYFKYQGGHRHDWKAAMAFVAANQSDEDLVVTYDQDQALATYYLKDDVIALDELDMSNAASRCHAIWFVDGQWGPSTLPESLKGGELVAVKDVHTPVRDLVTRVYRLRSDPSQCNQSASP